jgi:phytoene/squalene synthetase
MSRRVYERIINVRAQDAGKAAMSVIDALQKYIEEDKGAQAVGLCAAFLLFCERFGLSPQDVFVATKNLMAHVAGDNRKDFEAVRLYLQNEVHA